MRAKKSFNPRLIARVSLELSVSEELVAEIGAFQSEYTVKVIKSGNLEGVTWPHLGKFIVNSKKLQYGTSAISKPKIETPNNTAP